MRAHGLDAGASAGAVVFHDALYVPRSCADDRPFAADVLTVHQKAYYDSEGATSPNDYDSPNPVAFLTVRPGARLLFALSGRRTGPSSPSGSCETRSTAGASAGRPALDTGGWSRRRGSTAAVTATRPAVGHAGAGGASVKAGDRVDAVLLDERTKKGGWKALHERSGLAGAIQNSGDVPVTKNAGDRVGLVVAFASAREVAFRFPTEPPGTERSQRK